jgi:hypothetical protein
MGTPTTGNHYQATTSKDFENFMYVAGTVTFGLCSYERKVPINPITNQNSNYSHSIT